MLQYAWGPEGRFFWVPFFLRVSLGTEPRVARGPWTHGPMGPSYGPWALGPLAFYLGVFWPYYSLEWPYYSLCVFGIPCRDQQIPKAAWLGLRKSCPEIAILGKSTCTLQEVWRSDKSLQLLTRE